MGINRIRLQNGSPAEMVKAQEAAASDPALDAIRQQLFGEDYVQDIGEGRGIAQYYTGFGLPQSLQFTPPVEEAAPVVDTTTPVVDTGGGGGGRGGDVDITTPDAGNTEFEQNLLDQGAGVQAEPGAPISAPGEGMLTQQAIDDLADYPITPVNEFPTGDASLAEQIAAEDRAARLANVQDPTNMLSQLGTDTPTVFDGTATLQDAGGIPELGGGMGPDYQGGEPLSFDDRYESIEDIEKANFPYGINPTTGEPYETPRTIADQKAVLGVVTEEDVVNPQSLLNKIGLGSLDPTKTAVMAAINKAVGAPVSLLVSALEALPQYEPTFEERTLEEELGVTEGGKFLGDPTESAFAGLNAVSAFGDPVETAKDRIETRLETIENNPNISTKFKNDTQTMIEEWETVTDKLGDIDDDPTGDAEIATETIGTLPEITEARQKQGEYIQEIKAQPVVQAGSQEAKDQQDNTGVANVSTGIGGKGSGGYQTSSGDVYASAEEAAEKGDGGGSGGSGGKIVCTMMNESYGFGSFRNKIWMKFHKDLSPEYQKGYHKLFLPLVKIAKTNKVVKKVLEHIAVHSTIDMRQATRGKTHLLGRVYRKILLPICYVVGKYAKR